MPFDALVKKHQLDRNPAIVLLAKIVNGADTDNTLWNQPEAAGLNAIAEGFRHLGFKDDHQIIAAETICALRLLQENGPPRQAGRPVSVKHREFCSLRIETIAIRAVRFSACQ